MGSAYFHFFLVDFSKDLHCKTPVLQKKSRCAGQISGERLFSHFFEERLLFSLFSFQKILKSAYYFEKILWNDPGAVIKGGYYLQYPGSDWSQTHSIMKLNWELENGNEMNEWIETGTEFTLTVKMLLSLVCLRSWFWSFSADLQETYAKECKIHMGSVFEFRNPYTLKCRFQVKRLNMTRKLPRKQLVLYQNESSVHTPPFGTFCFHYQARRSDGKVMNECIEIWSVFGLMMKLLLQYRWQFLW